MMQASDFLDSHGKIYTENLGPKPNGLIVFFITRPQGAPFPIHKKPRQSHGELRKEVVIGQREGELQPAPKRGIEEIRVHFCSCVFRAPVQQIESQKWNLSRRLIESSDCY